MVNAKFLSALCYFSVFFFPLLLPIIIYFVTDHTEVKYHAKKSFISHVIPIILLIVGVIIFSVSMFSIENRFMNIINGGFDMWSVTPFIFTLLYSLLYFIIMIWNVIQGVKLLK